VPAHATQTVACNAILTMPNSPRSPPPGNTSIHPLRLHTLAAVDRFSIHVGCQGGIAASQPIVNARAATHAHTALAPAVRCMRARTCFSQFDHAVRVEWCTTQGDHTHTWPECGCASMLSKRAWQRWLCVHESLVSLLGDRIAVGWVAARVTTCSSANGAICTRARNAVHARHSSCAARHSTHLPHSAVPGVRGADYSHGSAWRSRLASKQRSNSQHPCSAYVVTKPAGGGEQRGRTSLEG
jgi:hypothetical protein